MRGWLKAVVAQTIFGSHLDALLLRNSAVVVTFHRVLDTEEPDGLTVSVALFETYCRFFKRHFNVVSLAHLVDKLEHGGKLNRELAITFDDGYRDNFEHAAPVLERLGLPATFFIVSQWIGSDVVPWWDRQGGVRYPWMTWDHVRSLQERGFHIGAHTRTHVDLGAVTGLQAREEIVGGRRELEERLGTPIELFAYPYGRQANLADANRSLIRGAGFRCCCSCFGGVVEDSSDPFHLRRVPITSGYPSPLQFGFEVALGRSVQLA
ncbi:MAG: polysaccharide deacetylase family protein [Vicinamibacterales bacterium]